MQATHIGIDPGSKNFAIAGLDYSGKLVFARMLNNPITSVSQANAHMRSEFRAAMRSILRTLNVKALIVENFTVRGFGTNSIELVGIMNGSVQEICDELKIKEHMVMPSSWKRDFVKHMGHELQDTYDLAREVGVPPHVVDAICLATYLQGGKTFEGVKEKVLIGNVRKASKLIQPDRLIKPKRVKK